LGQNIKKIEGTFNSDQFKKTKLSKSSESDKIWLNLHNDQGAFSQILIGFIEGATNGIDRDYDGTRFFGDNPVAFYSICEDIKLAIQGRDLRTELEIIPLGVYTSINTDVNLQISIDELQGQLTNTNIEIIIEDQLLGIQHDLKKGSYSFNLSSEGSYDDRFNISIKELNVLNIDSFNIDDNLILKHYNNQLNVRTKDKKIISSFKAFDCMGRTIIDVDPNEDEFSVSTVNIKNGTVLILNVTVSDNLYLSKKIILLN